MPIPILVAAVGMVVSAAGGGAGGACFLNNKHNKAKKKWQDEKKSLQERIRECQEQIVEKQELITELQGDLVEANRKIAELTAELNECDRMIDVLEQRHREMDAKFNRIIAFLTLRYGKLTDKIDEVQAAKAKHLSAKSQSQRELETARADAVSLDACIRSEQSKLRYHESEAKDLKVMEGGVGESPSRMDASKALWNSI